MTKLAFMSVLVFLSSAAHAFDMSSICQNIAENYVSQQFQAEFNSPKVWVDSTNPGSANNYPNYVFEIRLSGKTQNTWAHEVWQVQTNSIRGGCGVIHAQMIDKSFDQ